MRHKLYFTILLLIFIPLTAQALSITPNDPYFSNQYYIEQTKVDKAWAYSVGSPEVVIAVIDSGVDLDHPDLKDNIWVNQDEIPDNNIDDDHNGYIDDVRGWNFVENNNDPNPQFSSYSTEGASHGTLVAGIIAASGHNSKGLAGITWNSKIMALRALNSLGEGNIEDAADAILYAADNGADIINLSFVGPSYTESFLDAVKYAYKLGAVLVAAVGNDAVGSAGLAGGNLDVQPVFPACFQTSFDNLVIGVGAVDKSNRKTDFSNFGQNCLDISAPGIDIVSTQVIAPSFGTPFNAKYSGFWNGTSFAAPQIAGLAALVKSINKNYNNKQITSLILDTADNLDTFNPQLKGLMGHGLLDAKRALAAAAPVNFTPQDPREIINLQKNNAALWIGDKVDKEALANNFLNLSISFKNKGTITWQPHFLKIKLTDWQGQPINFRDQELFYQNSQNVLPSQTATFYRNLRTPGQSGIYHIKFQLNYKEQDIKGGGVYKTIKIISLKPGVIIEDNLPIAVRQSWGTIPITLKIKNNTKAAWTQKTLSLLINSDDENFYLFTDGTKINRIEPQELEILPGETGTFISILNFQEAALGVRYYTLTLEAEQEILSIEAGERVMRID